ncbi:MAG: ferrochelatase [Campylobacter sp.]|nr:ferrochelatase [Campylobacter sp.]
MKKVIILLNMGGPNNLDEVPLFLKNMFNDPCILEIKNRYFRKFIALIITKSRKKESKKIYEAIGGKSPIIDITENLCKKITQKRALECNFVMRYAPPFAEDILVKYKDYEEITLFPLYPHHSKTTVLSSIKDAKETLKRLKFGGRIREISIFYKSNEYNEILLNLIKEQISDLSSGDIRKTTLIFSAHSMPKSHIKNGDLYQEHTKEHVEILKDILIKEGINFGEILLTYQSKLGPVKWLEPSTEHTLQELKSKRVLLFPISFCIDNSETDYELSIEYKNLAKSLSYEFFRVCKCPNDSDEFVNFIVNSLK